MDKAEQSSIPSRPQSSAADYVVNAIQTRITTDALPNGYRLGTKTELKDQYRVAPATLGEALRLLRGRGLVDVHPGPGGGVFVASPSPLMRLAQEVTELRGQGAPINYFLEVVDALDTIAIEHAARYRTEQDLAELDALVADVRAKWHQPYDGLHPNWQLHRRIAAISPNVVLRTFYLNVVDYIGAEAGVEHGLGPIGFVADSDERLRVHTDIVEAIRSQDDAQVEHAIRQHRSKPTS